LKTIILKILILGGTSFLGPHLVDELHQRGHKITLFNRGTQELTQFPDVEKLQGDRYGNLAALKDRTWDAVIDTSGHLPGVVEASSKVLINATNHYTFVSTVGVYADFQNMGINEEYPAAVLEYPTEEITEQNYGALKACCEQVIQNYFPGRSLIVRPGLIVGPGDPTDRFTYWPRRLKEGGDILAPGEPNQNVQFIDVRDLAWWIVDQVEKQVTGCYNVTGKPIPFQDLLAGCQKVTQADAIIHWASEDFLIRHHVQDWVELPLWLSSKRNMPGFLNVSIEKALASGLNLRPLGNTIADLLEWDAQRVNAPQTGLSREKEQELIQLWNLEAITGR
jgi:2'-hydroxyisoflavone reductase